MHTFLVWYNGGYWGSNVGNRPYQATTAPLFSNRAPFIGFSWFIKLQPTAIQFSKSVLLPGVLW